MTGKIKCVGCGYEMDYVSGRELVCPFCQTVQHVKLSADIIDLLSNANALRRIGKFKKAKIEYQNVIKQNSDVAEAYFGLFLSDYKINNEDGVLNGEKDEVLKEVCATTCVEDNINYKTALAKCSLERENWETIGKTIEEFRKRNKIIDDEILKNKYMIVLLADEENKNDVHVADNIYAEFRNKFDIFYPKETLSEIDKSLIDVSTCFGLEEISLLFVVCSNNKCSSKLETFIKRFCKTWDEVNIVFIGNVPENLVDTLTNDFEPLEISNDIYENMFKKVYLKADISMEETKEFMNSGVRLNDKDNPSPKLKLEDLK